MQILALFGQLVFVGTMLFLAFSCVNNTLLGPDDLIEDSTLNHAANYDLYRRS